MKRSQPFKQRMICYKDVIVKALQILIHDGDLWKSQLYKKITGEKWFQGN